MQTVRPRSSSFVLLLVVAASCLLSGAGRALAQIQTLQGCIDQWRATVQTCCNTQDPEIQDLCFDMANDQLAACLKNLPLAQKPSNCWNYAINLAQTQCGGLPCNTEKSRRACRRAARTIHRWCIGLDPAVSVIDATPTWELYPTTVQVGNAYELVVRTDDAAVDRVRFFAIRMDAPAGAADPVFEIGSAVPQPVAGNRVLWSLTTDTGDWPLEAGEQRVVIVARSEAFTSATATKILDISTLIEVEIE